MISNKVLRTFVIPNRTIKFLQKQDPSHKSKLSILLRKKVLKTRVISINNHMKPNQVRSKFLKTKYYSQKFFLSDSVMQLGIIQSVTSIINDMGFISIPYPKPTPIV